MARAPNPNPNPNPDPDPNPNPQLLEEDPGGDGLASEQTLQILRRAATGAEQSVIACADTIVEEAAGLGSGLGAE